MFVMIFVFQYKLNYDIQYYGFTLSKIILRGFILLFIV